MKKKKLSLEILSKRRLNKKLKRKRIIAKRISGTPNLKYVSFRVKEDRKVIDNSKFKLNDFLNEHTTFEIEEKKEVLIPKNFTLEQNHKESLKVISQIRHSILKFKGRSILLDFSRCKTVDYGCLFLLKIIVEEYLSHLGNLQRRVFALRVRIDIKIKISKISDEVNNMLVLSGIAMGTTENESQFQPVNMLNFMKGSRPKRPYADNWKSTAATRIRKYVNQNLKRQNFELDEYSAGYLDGIITEVLNNAEDHSPFDTWYVGGNLSETKRTDNSNAISEVNLAFLNFGYSIFQGFEDSKVENIEMYSDMFKMHETVSAKIKSKLIEKEQLFTLYALQDGFSRLRYADESRGTGTMKFINSFLYLGDYEDQPNGIVPSLTIFSGNTYLKCDCNYRPFQLDNVNFLSLNKENLLTEPPEDTHLHKTDTYIPGTLLVVKLYLSEENLKNKVSKNAR